MSLINFLRSTSFSFILRFIELYTFSVSFLFSLVLSIFCLFSFVIALKFDFISESVFLIIPIKQTSEPISVTSTQSLLFSVRHNMCLSGGCVCIYLFVSSLSLSLSLSFSLSLTPSLHLHINLSFNRSIPLPPCVQFSPSISLSPILLSSI